MSYRISVYKALARALARPEGDARDELIAQIMETAPSGSGIDSGTKLEEGSRPDRIVFEFGYHHMNEVGYYDGWTDHRAKVYPDPGYDFRLEITGRDRNQIKDYLHQTFHLWLTSPIDPYNPGTYWDIQREAKLFAEHDLSDQEIKVWRRSGTQQIAPAI